MAEKLNAKAYMLSDEVLEKVKIPAKVCFENIEEYRDKSLHFAMNAGIEVTKGGRLYSCWIGGEDGSESYVIVTYSDDLGVSWKEIQFIIDPRNDDLPHSVNAHVAGLWRDPKDRLWLFFHQSFGMWDGQGAVFAMICDQPDAENPVWSEPRLITPGAVIKKPIVLSNGEWLMPVSIWERWHITYPLGDCHHECDDIRGADVFASNDEGKTWSYRGGVIFKDSCFNEHSITQLSNGEIMMISRCNGAIKKSYSSDFGKSWSEEELYFNHVSGYSSMATLRKLSSGNLLLIKHGLTMEDVTPKRTHLTAFISKDDGKSWQGGLLLDERDSVSYPDICESEDGTIFVQYDYNRESDAEILFARFREEDVLAGRTVSPNAALRQIIKDLNGIKGVGNTLFAGAADGFASGDGSEDNPFVISSAEEYLYLSKRVYKGETFKGTHFVQRKDIDFGGKELVPVGALMRPFSATFDGNGHYMHNFKMTGSDIHTRAVFGYLYEGTVKNVKVKNAYINGKTSIAAVVGFAVGTTENKAIVENCTAEDSVRIISYKNAGGIVGRIEGNALISNSVNKASVHFPHAVAGNEICGGGIAGITDSDAVIENCNNFGNISAKYAIKARLGGIAGGKKAVSVVNCKNEGNISINIALSDVFLGGICGKIESSIQIIDCQNTGKITAKDAEFANIDQIAHFFE